MSQFIQDIKAKLLRPGIEGHYAHGNEMTFGYVTILPGSVMEEHSHPHEQITYILEGSLEMQIGGEEVILHAGMVQVIPSNIPHAAKTEEGCKLIDVFSPVRADYAAR